jgi:hypothetical protein
VGWFGADCNAYRTKHWHATWLFLFDLAHSISDDGQMRLGGERARRTHAVIIAA